MTGSRSVPRGVSIKITNSRNLSCSLTSTSRFRRDVTHSLAFLFEQGTQVQQSPPQSDQSPSRLPILATMPGPDPLWNTYVYDYLPSDAGTLKDYLALFRLSRGRKILILNGSVGRKQLYRDLVFAILLKFFSTRPPPVLMQDATWEPSSEALAKEFPFLKNVIPRLARMAISMLDGPHVRYAVLSTSEVKTFPKVWGVDPHRVVFQPFPHTLHGHQDMPTRDDGYIFAGGNSFRNYGMLLDAVEGTGVKTRIATQWKPQVPLENVEIGPTSHDDFMHLLGNSHAVVVPLRQMVRSAGQQTYLNAMGLAKPVIVTDGPGVRDYVIDGVTGVIVPPDAQKLREAILHVMDPANAAMYAEMGRRAREDVLTRFTEQHFRHGLLMHAGVISREEFERGKKEVHLGMFAGSSA
jgi:glycosyltransferase involved in cell wall biosynthesis